MKKLLSIVVLGSSLALASVAAKATTVNFSFFDGSATVASGSFSFNELLSGNKNNVNGFGSLTDFSLNFFSTSGAITNNFTLAEVTAMNTYKYFKYDVSANSFLAKGGSNGAPMDSLLYASNKVNVLDPRTGKKTGTRINDGFNFNNASMVYDDLSNLAPEASFTRVALNVVPVTPVPEPESYAMLLAGLGLMATIARRRRAKLVN